jgi:integrating conjugative element protein (TIGR03755 family)
MRNSIIVKLLLISMFLPLLNVQAQIIPSGTDSFYYKLGGGQAIPVPVFMSESSIPLDVGGNVGLNYNCGVFNPILSITNSLNNIKSSFQNMEKTVVANATAAIGEFPMYMIARANGPLYNLLNNGLFEAQKDLELSTKSCQVLQNEIAAGQNPYKDWARVSMGNDWSYHMSLASNDSAADALNGTNDDINQVKHDVQQDNGDKGVPWVQGKDIGRGGLYAGGKGQPAILVIRDTAVAGYNVALQSGRSYDDTTPPSKTPQNEHLVTTWANPTVAAKWLTNVVGDEKVTTYTGGDKSSTPGVGLLPENSTITTDVTKELVKLVSSEEKCSIKNLQNVSAPTNDFTISISGSINVKF